MADEEDYSRLELLCKAADGSPAVWAAVKGDYAPAKKLKYEPAGLALWGDGLTAEELRNKLSGLGESGLPLALRWDAELAGEELTELVQKNNLTRLLPVLPEVAGREYIARSESWQNTGGNGAAGRCDRQPAVLQCEERQGRWLCAGKLRRNKR